jgi:mono/diheme cytochrome c family protein
VVSSNEWSARRTPHACEPVFSATDDAQRQQIPRGFLRFRALRSGILHPCSPPVRPSAGAAGASLFLLALLSGACVQTLDPRDVPGPVPVVVVARSGPPDRAALWVDPGGWVAPGTLPPGTLAWQAGSRRLEGAVTWWPSLGLLRWEPVADTGGDPVWALQLRPDTLALLLSGGGTLVQPAEALEPLTADRVPELPPTIDPMALPPPDWPEIEALFTQHCAACHDGRGAPPLSWERLTLPDAAEGRPEVLSGRTQDSALIRRITPGAPLRGLTPMPPPWSGQPLMPREARTRVEHWVAVGAPGPLPPQSGP